MRSGTVGSQGCWVPRTRRRRSCQVPRGRPVVPQGHGATTSSHARARPSVSGALAVSRLVAPHQDLDAIGVRAEADRQSAVPAEVRRVGPPGHGGMAGSSADPVGGRQPLVRQPVSEFVPQELLENSLVSASRSACSFVSCLVARSKAAVLGGSTGHWGRGISGGKSPGPPGPSPPATVRRQRERKRRKL